MAVAPRRLARRPAASRRPRVRPTLVAIALLAVACTSNDRSPSTIAAPSTTTSSTTSTVPPTTTTAVPRACEDLTSPRRIHPIGDSLTAGSAFFDSYRGPLWTFLTTIGGQSGATIDFVGTHNSTPAPVAPDAPVVDGDHDGVGGYTTGPDNGVPGANVSRYIEDYVAEPGMANFGTGKDWVSFADPDVVLLNIGSNDDEADRAVVRRRLDDLTRLIRSKAPDAIVVLSSLPPSAKPYERARLVGEEARDLAAASDGRVLFADLYTGMMNGNTTLGTTAIDEVLDRPSPSPEGVADTIHFNASGARKLAAAWYPTVIRALGMPRCAPDSPVAGPVVRSGLFRSAPEFSSTGSGPALVTGVRIRTATAGAVTAIRWFKDLADTGTHVVTLWSTDGRVLGRAVASNESASGWQNTTFDAPVAVPAGEYVAAVSHPTGNHTVTLRGLSAAVRGNPVGAPADGDGGANGVYVYSNDAITFPTDTFRSSNYWVDVVFRAA